MRPATGRDIGSDSQQKKQVIVVDDHPMIRAGLRLVINDTPDLETSREAGNAAEALECVKTGAADLLVLDLDLPDRSGLDALKDLLVIQPDLPVLVVSVFDELVYAERALRGGARGYVMKDAGPDQILEAVRVVLTGGVFVSTRLKSWILTGRRHSQGQLALETLSDREFEVFRLLADCHSSRSIAKRLQLSPKTVDAHKGTIKSKLGLKNGSELAFQAQRWAGSHGQF